MKPIQNLYDTKTASKTSIKLSGRIYNDKTVSKFLKNKETNSKRKDRARNFSSVASNSNIIL